MPRDDWARLRAKDLARRAKAPDPLKDDLARRADQALKEWKSARGQKPGKPAKLSRKQRRLAKKRARQQKATQRAKSPYGFPCSKCKSLEVTRKIEVFKDGTMHIRLSCAKCGKFIKWQRHQEVPDHIPL